MTASHLPRRTYLIDRAFQLKYAWMFAGVGGSTSLLFGLMAYLAHLHVFSELGSNPSLAAELRQAEFTLLWLMLGTAVLMAGALGLFGVLVTHRVAGPMQVMNHYLSLVAAGRYPTMRPLRKHDELKDVFGGLQSAIVALREREAAEARTLDVAIKALLAANASSAIVDELRALSRQKLAAVGAGDSGSRASGAASQSVRA